MRPAALVIGMAASPTDDGQMPTTASTLLISISFFTASTAASGLVWSSSAYSCICLPAAPPAALTSAMAILIA
ncbi:hypothetical protein G6F66_015609 [Rhizopus arrhizus]|nr:hypothetical protein G6F66_015609 [Rhizopus arrhizus]